MYTYEGTKAKAFETISHGATAMLMARDHEETRQMAYSIIEACKCVLALEDLAEAFEKGDLAGMENAMTKNGF